jgi:hypothetical protein
MNWLHHALDGLMGCGMGILAYTLWYSLAQETKMGKVHDLRRQVASRVGISLIALTSSWEAVASPQPYTVAEHIQWGMMILAIAAFIYAIIGRRPASLR